MKEHAKSSSTTSAEIEPSIGHDCSRHVEPEERPDAGNDGHKLGARLLPAVVAIDGPAASGKSTVGRLVAEALGYLFFDTGVMYRAVTWSALERGLDAHDGEKMGELAESVVIDIVPATGGVPSGVASAVLVDGRDVSDRIRTTAVDNAVSAVSAHGTVRAALSRQQRRVAQEYGAGNREKAGVVMVGRDIGSVVIPEAPVKVYLDATAEERARRRFKELQDKGAGAEYEQVLSDIQRRDRIDSSRELAPLTVADGATRVDTTALSPAEVVARILDLARRSVS